MFQGLPSNKQQFLLFVDLKPGIQRFYLELGGFIMIKYRNRPQLENFYRLDRLWLEEKGILFNQIECKWGLPFCLRLINNQLKDIKMIARFISKKMKKGQREQSRISYIVIKRIKNLNNLPSLACKQLQNRK